jgi:uncharacterized delta-60 repeat protein
MKTTTGSLAAACCLGLATAAHGDFGTTFDENGFVAVDVPGEKDFARGVVVQNDGKLLIARANERELSVVRLNADGSVDSTFGNNGVASAARADGPTDTVALLEQPDGTLIVAGTVVNQIVVAKLLGDGRLDTSFGTHGLAWATNLPAALATVVVRQADGKLVVGGASTSGGRTAALVRFDAAGVLDTGFGAAGVALPGGQKITALTQQADGKLVAAVQTDPNLMTVVRLTRDGALDASFDGDGSVTIESGLAYGAATAVAVQADGKIVVAGQSCSELTCASPARAVVARRASDGQPDSSFGSAGSVSFAAGTPVSYGSVAMFVTPGGLLVEPTGAIVVGGDIWNDDFYYDFVIPFDVFLARVTPNGTLDASFAEAGVRRIDVGHDEFASWATLYGVGRQSDGRLVAAMTTEPRGDARIAVLRTTGAAASPGRLGFLYATGGGAEGGEARLTVRRTGGATGAVTVDFSTESTTAESGADFAPSTGTLAWGDGDPGDREIRIPILTDTLTEADERFIVKLSNPSLGTTLSATVARVVIYRASGRPAPSASTGGGGGGGSGSPIEAALLALLALWRAGRRTSSTRANQ